MHKTLQQLEEIFQTIHCPFDEEKVLELNKLHPATLNNVVVGLEEHCYGFMCTDDKEVIKYQLFYVNVGMNYKVI